MFFFDWHKNETERMDLDGGKKVFLSLMADVISSIAISTTTNHHHIALTGGKGRPSLSIWCWRNDDVSSALRSLEEKDIQLRFILWRKI